MLLNGFEVILNLFPIYHHTLHLNQTLQNLSVCATKGKIFILNYIETFLQVKTEY